MKRTIKIALVLCLVLLASVLMFTACDISTILPTQTETTLEGTSAPEETTPSTDGHTHVWSAWITVKEPQCKEAGLTQRYCTVCSYTESQPTNALGHTEVVDEAVAPTCEKAGLTEGKHCSVCGEILVAQEIVPTTEEHNYISTIIPPTAAEDGYVAHTCSNCGDTYADSYVTLTNFTVTAKNRTMVGYTGAAGESLVIPATFESKNTWYRVAIIDNEAFYGCDNLTSVTIPDSVTSIGYCAFSDCSSLTSVTIPDSVTSIGDGAFLNCNSLVCNEYDNAYYIGNNQNPYLLWLRAKSNAITSCVIHKDTRFIDALAFSNCTSLTNIVVDKDNTAYQSIDGNLYTKDGKILIAYAIGKKDANFTIPDSVTSIGDYAFFYCDSLTSVTIPDSVTSIGYSAFSWCTSLTNIIVDKGNTAYQSIDGNLYSKDGKMLVAYANGKKDANFTIPDSVTSIGDYAFEWCYSLTSITIPDSVTSIGYRAFSDCSSLTSVTIPDSVTSIGGGAFYGCTSLTSVTIPDSVTSIGNSAFLDCDSLTSVAIPDSATSIGDYAFSDCDSLTNIFVDKNNTAYQSIDGNLYTKDGKTLIAYAIGKKDANFTIPDSVTSIGDYAFFYCDALTSVTIPDSITRIGNYAFCNCDSLTSVTIPDSVTRIGNYAFYGCDALTSVTIPDSITRIGNYAFCNCDSLTSVTIPDSVTRIGNYAFYGCDALTSITIPDSVTSIGDRAFSFCISLASVTVPDSVTSIGYGTFSICISLTSITIPDSVTSIGDDAFSYCSSLTSVTIPDSVTRIGNYAFYVSDALTGITIPDSVTSIGDRAFSFCTSLASVTIPDSVTSIGDDALSNCISLTSITIPDSVTSIGDDEFYGCTSLTSVTIPDSVTNIGNYAFYWCTSLTSITFEGTVEQWNAISKGDYWKDSVPATEVVCSDGTIPLY